MYFSFLVVLLLSSCTHLPKNPEKTVSHALPARAEVPLAAHSRSVLAHAGEGVSSFMLVPSNRQAMRWRLALIDQAEDSIDLQVFIWSNDEAGRLLLSRLIAAANRGVRVRILVDDMMKEWTDRGTSLVDRMENIEVRRFNPGRIRRGLISKTLQMSLQFRELNRRMHNKQMVVDGQFAIMGGRNIGNSYYGLSKKYNNQDMDLLMTGPILQHLSHDFDEFWNSDAAYPGYAMHRGLSEKKEQALIAGFKEIIEADKPFLRKARIPPEPVNWDALMEMLPVSMTYGTAEIFKDSPEVSGDRGERLITKLNGMNLDVKKETVIITPYMIPSDEMMEQILEVIQKEGRSVRMLVPSMESNNHTMVHSHYRKYRKKLLEAGVELYELRAQPSPELRKLSDADPVKANFISLHTKGFIFDSRWVMLGSLNLDPRSIQINTEHMLLIDSPELAEQLLARFDQLIDNLNSWTVHLDEKGRVRWESNGEVLTGDPNRGIGQRISAFFYRWLPIEGQL